MQSCLSILFKGLNVKSVIAASYDYYNKFIEHYCVILFFKFSLFMKRRFLFFLFFVACSSWANAQEIIFSEPFSEDNRDMNFDIIGKVNNNIIIFKNLRYRYSLNVYNDSMVLNEKVDLDFLPGKVFNVDYVAYPDFFYLIYQYQKKNIVYCVAVKMDADGKKMSEPVELDTTQISGMSDNKIYSTINSDDRKKIMVFKIQKREDKYQFATILFDDQLQVLHKSRHDLAYDDNRSTFSDFLLDNEGNFIFSAAVKTSNRAYYSSLFLITKHPTSDNFLSHTLNLNKTFVDEVKIKIDNLNKRYILNSFFYRESNGPIDGLFCSIWDATGDSVNATVLSHFDNDLRSMAKSSGNAKNAFNDFFIRNIILKKDGSYIIHAEDYSSQSSGLNNWNRNDFLYGSPYLNSYNYYNYYNPGFGGYYRPYGLFGNGVGGGGQNTRNYYDNIVVLSVAKNGIPEWTNIIPKQQFSDDRDNHLSYSTFSTGGELHFIFNDITRRDKLLMDKVLSLDGTIKRNPTLRTYDQGYEFMPRFAKKIGSRQVIIPSTYRGKICFAKVDF